MFDVYAPHLPSNAAEHLSGNDGSQSVCVGQIPFFQISVNVEKTIRMLFAVELTCLTSECGNDALRMKNAFFFMVTSPVIIFERNCGSEVFLMIVAHSDTLFLIGQQIKHEFVGIKICNILALSK